MLPRENLNFFQCQKRWFLAFWLAVRIIANAVTAKFEFF